MLSQRGAADPMSTTGHWQQQQRQQHHQGQQQQQQQRLHHQLCTNCTPDIFICCEGYQTRESNPNPKSNSAPTAIRTYIGKGKGVGPLSLAFSDSPLTLWLSGVNPVTPVKALIDINRVIYDHCNGWLRLRVALCYANLLGRRFLRAVGVICSRAGQILVPCTLAIGNGVC